jgi:hypothetical protein
MKVSAVSVVESTIVQQCEHPLNHWPVGFADFLAVHQPEISNRMSWVRRDRLLKARDGLIKSAQATEKIAETVVRCAIPRLGGNGSAQAILSSRLLPRLREHGREADQPNCRLGLHFCRATVAG